MSMNKWLVILFVLAYLVVSTTKIPRCAEDQVIIGTGQFESGRWSSYECGPAWDDYKY